MKRIWLQRIICVLLLGLAITAAATAATPPNIVLIISDDHGWQDYSFMGHPHIRTPRLDKLAAQSLVFKRGYVPNALCSPSLASIITGRYPHEHLVTYNDPPAPPGGKVGKWQEHPQYLAAWDEMRSFITRVPTLPRLLQAKGYVSLQTGKWWLGTPANGGFTAGMSHGEKTRGGRHGDEGLDIGRKTMQPIYDFIGNARSQNKPFLVWYAPMLPHSPHTAPQRLIDKYKPLAPSLEHARYWASVEWFDETCGQLLDYLDREKLADNTIVVYVADNGWIQSDKGDAQSLRSKRTPYDAGIRTPIMVRWPGKVTPAKSNRLASSLDILPTLLAATGIKAPPKLPGINLLKTKAVNARTTLFGGCFTHDAVELRNPAANVLSRWVIDGHWKLIVPVPGRKGEDVPDHPLLYNLAGDVEEREDLSAREPQRVAVMQRKLDAWWKP
ncbi:MAG: sulfatase [Acidobacteria bacterium]|nr:sulfatase [Acidobacteriota bacterium]